MILKYKRMQHNYRTSFCTYSVPPPLFTFVCVECKENAPLYKGRGQGDSSPGKTPGYHYLALYVYQLTEAESCLGV
jgi:hypothetical protein